MKKLIVSLLVATVFALSSPAQVHLLDENFSSQALPTGWTNDSLGLAAVYQWEFNNPGLRSVIGAGFDTSFVILDSDHYGSLAAERASLTTVAVSAIGYTALWLETDEQYYTQQGPGSFRMIEASGDSGANWYTVVLDSVSTGYPVAGHYVYRIDSLAGSANVMIRFTYGGAWDYWWALDNIRLLATMDCTTPPEAGQAVSSQAEVCSTTPFTLSLSGDSSGTGLTYQWQISSDSLAWSDISNATTREYTTLQNAAAWYRCLVFCSGQPDTSGTVYVAMQPSSRCYCLPQTPACTQLNYITRVSISGTPLDNISACSDALSGTSYSSYPATGNMTAVLQRLVTYDLSVFSVGNNSLSMWIDYDHSGTFDFSEYTRVDLSSVQGSPSVVSLTIPDTILPGLTGMRIRSRAFGNSNGPGDACTAFASGETEDYYITLDTLISGTTQPVLEGFSIYPNPSNGQFRLQFGRHTPEGATVSVYDRVGSLVKELKTTGLSTWLDLSQFTDGLYVVHILSGSKTAVRKVIIRHD